MAIRIEGNSSLRSAAATVGFCYLCGQSLSNGEPANLDHVISKNSWLVDDRNLPLKLPTHIKCNTTKSAQDEILSQILHSGRGTYPVAHQQRVDLVQISCQNLDQPIVGVRNFPDELVWKWVQGFHTALYREYLDLATPKAFNLPLPLLETHAKSVTEAKTKQQTLVFVELIKKNRLVDCTDSVKCYNGRCIFECVWIPLSSGKWSCVFALKVDDWENLAPTPLVRKRGCVGIYQARKQPPKDASEDSIDAALPPNIDPLDPFGP